MKLGIVCPGEKFASAAKAGFEYVEPPLAPLRALPGSELRKISEAAENAGVSIDGFCCFFEGHVKLYGPDRTPVLDYAKRNFEICAGFGAAYTVIGSGFNRRVPPGMNRADAEKEFTELVSRIGETAKKYKIEIYVEPLSKAETDLINTLSDGIRVSRAAGRDNVRPLVDFYHFYVNGEDPDELDLLAHGELGHVHLARPDADRRAPSEEDAPVLAVWAEKLRSAGYDGRITAECAWGGDFDGEAARASSVIRKYFFTRE